MSGSVILADRAGHVVSEVATKGIDDARIGFGADGSFFASDLDADYRIGPTGFAERLVRPTKYQGAATHSAMIMYSDGSALSVFNHGVDQSSSDGSYRSYASLIPRSGNDVDYIDLGGYPGASGMCGNNAWVILTDPLSDSGPKTRLVSIDQKGSVTNHPIDNAAISPQTDLSCSGNSDLVFAGSSGSGEDPFTDPLMLVSVTPRGKVTLEKLIDAASGKAIFLAGDAGAMSGRAVLANHKFVWSYSDGSVWEADVASGQAKQRLPRVDASEPSYLGALSMRTADSVVTQVRAGSVAIDMRPRRSGETSVTVAASNYDDAWTVTDVVAVPSS